MKKINFLASIILLGILTSCNQDKPLNKEEGDITLDIIEINDLHGYVDSASKTSGIDLSNISYYINEKRNKDDNEVVLIANGDMFEGTAFSNLSRGLSTLNVMNEMGFDAMGVGNHEYSWGLNSILQFFDKNEENGEANFPLINGNIYTNGKRNGEENQNDNILPYTIVEKGDYKVGILSYIGDVASSISASYLNGFEIQAKSNFFETQVKEDALKLKEYGADFIVFNIHGGNADSIEDYDVNKTVAGLKDSSGNYLIDAVINGHTHSRQKGFIERTNDQKLPLVQGGSYCDSFGEIELVIDSKTKTIKDVGSKYIETKTINKDNKDNKSKAVIDTEYNKIKTTVEATYGENPSKVSRANLGILLAKELRIANSADISIMNTGGIRTELPKGTITFNNVYAVYPFENHIIYLKAKGSYINAWLKKYPDTSYYYMDYTGTFEDNETYNIVTIDYVYDSKYFPQIFKDYQYIGANLTITPRDYFLNDLQNRNESKLNINGQVMVDINPFPEQGSI